MTRHFNERRLELTPLYANPPSHLLVVEYATSHLVRNSNGCALF